MSRFMNIPFTYIVKAKTAQWIPEEAFVSVETFKEYITKNFDGVDIDDLRYTDIDDDGWELDLDGIETIEDLEKLEDKYVKRRDVEV